MSSSRQTRPRLRDPVRAQREEAWAGDPPSRNAARERLLDAAAGCIARDGLAAVGIASVAAEAGVSRPTVYRYFSDRQALIDATLERVGLTLLVATEQHLRAFPDPAAQAVEGVLFVLREIPRDPVLSEVWNSVTIDAAALAGFTSEHAIRMAAMALKPMIETAGWTERQAAEAVETLLRFALALLAAPTPRRRRAQLRAYLERRLVPALGL